MEEVYIKNDCYVLEKYFKNQDIVKLSDVISKLEDLDSDVERLEEEFKDYKQNIEDNYRQISVAEQVGYREGE